MMSTPVMFVLSALLVTMVTCSGHEEADPNYVDNGMDGTWYIMGNATNHWTAYDRTKVTTVVVATTITGLSVSAKFSERTSSSDASCTTIDTLQWEKEEEKGHFKYTNTKEYEVVVLLFNTIEGYAVIHTADADHDCINELYSRNPKVTQAVKDEFERISFADDKIPPSNVKFMAKDEECRP